MCTYSNLFKLSDFIVTTSNNERCLIPRIKLSRLKLPASQPA